MYNLDDILLLIQKKIDGSISLEELSLLNHLLSRNPYLKEVIDKIEDESFLWEDVVRKIELDQSDDSSWEKRLKENVLQKLDNESGQQQTMRNLKFLWMKIAGAIALIVSISFLYMVFRNDKQAYNIEIVDEISAPSEAIILRLNDGSMIELESSKSALLVGAELHYADGELLQYDLDSVEMMDLEVPKGKSFQIMLSDRTKVWLNSGSKLRYPMKFEDDKREVELEGEGYFEVAEKTHKHADNNTDVRTPFLIKTRKQIVEVIGTAFNIEAYGDDKLEKTTLVHGKVKVYLKEEEDRGVELIVGEQSATGANKITKRLVDLDDVIGWRQDMFVFNNTDFDQALKTLSRWYDFDVVYEGEIPKSQFFAEIKRSNKLSTVLKILEKGGIRFRMEKYGDRFRLVVK